MSKSNTIASAFAKVAKARKSCLRFQPNKLISDKSLKDILDVTLVSYIILFFPADVHDLSCVINSFISHFKYKNHVLNNPSINPSIHEIDSTIRI